MVKLTTGEKIARDLCEMDATIGNAIEVDPVDVARRIDEAMLELSQQLAAEQLNNKLLRDALEVLAKLGNGDRYGNSEGNVIAQQALTSPSDTSALDAYVAEKVKESHKVIPREGLVPHAYQLEATHNNAEYWFKWGHSEEMAAKGESVICMAHAVFAWRNAAYSKAKEVATLTRQRDLAVGALGKWDMFFGSDAETAVLTIAEDPSTLTGCQKATKEALSTIKESEGKLCAH